MALTVFIRSPHLVSSSHTAQDSPPVLKASNSSHRGVGSNCRPVTQLERSGDAMDDAVLEKVMLQQAAIFQKDHRDSPASLHQSFPLHVSFDHGYFLTVRAIQELRDSKGGSICVGIGGPSGSGKSSLATKIASVLGGAVIDMENYHDPLLTEDDSNAVESIDFELLIQNIEDLMNGNNVMTPQFDFQEKRRAGVVALAAPKSGVVLVEGTYALHSKLRSLLDIRVAVVGGVHFNLLSKVRGDIGETLSLDQLIDSIFPMFRSHIEPDLYHAQIRISNNVVSLSLREPYYILKTEKQPLNAALKLLFGSSNVRQEQYIEMYLSPPSARDFTKTSDWIRMRQCGIRYDLAEGDQRIVDKHFIIKPRVEFEVGKTTLGGLLALGYQIAVSYKRESTIIDNGKVSVSIETIDDLETSFLQIKGLDRKVVVAEAAALGVDGPWITRSYMEMVLQKKGLPRLDSPPLPSSAFVASTSSSEGYGNVSESGIISPSPIRVVRPSHSLKPPETSEAWTRSPTKTDLEPVIGSWHITTTSGAGTSTVNPVMTSQKVVAGETAKTSEVYWGDPGPSTQGHPSSGPKGTVKLLPMRESFDFDRGLLLAVQAAQVLLNAKGPPIVLGIGGPSGSGKTSLARKMANIVGCEVISMESYYKGEEKTDSSYDDFSALDIPLLLRNIREMRASSPTMIPLFNFEMNKRSGSKEFKVAPDCGVVILEGVYALHPDIRPSLDVWIAVIGGVHSHLVDRVHRDLECSGQSTTRQEVMTTVFPMFQQHIEPHLAHAHLKICNDFDPVHSLERSMFVLKSSKPVTAEDIVKILDPERRSRTVQNFIDIYFHLPGLPSVSQCTESNWIRVRNCEGRFALLIREPIREGDFIIQPRVDFDISVRTVAGLLALGYEAVAYIEATATIYQDDKLLVEVDHLKNISTPYVQIKGSNKEAVAAAGQALNLEGSYTTMPYIEIVLGRESSPGDGTGAVKDPQAARLQELVQFVQSQGGIPGSTALVTSPVLSLECVLESLEMRVRKLEKLQLINSVIWTFMMSSLVGYMLYQRYRRFSL